MRRVARHGRSPVVFASQGGKPFSITSGAACRPEIAALPHGFDPFPGTGGEEPTIPGSGERRWHVWATDEAAYGGRTFRAAAGLMDWAAYLGGQRR